MQLEVAPSCLLISSTKPTPPLALPIAAGLLVVSIKKKSILDSPFPCFSIYVIACTLSTRNACATTVNAGKLSLSAVTLYVR